MGADQTCVPVSIPDLRSFTHIHTDTHTKVGEKFAWGPDPIWPDPCNETYKLPVRVCVTIGSRGLRALLQGCQVLVTEGCQTLF